jgi:hypothetical protein
VTEKRGGESERRSAEVTEALSARNRQGANLIISNVIPNYLGGELIVVEVQANGAKVADNYYYRRTKEYGYPDSESFVSFDELARWMSEKGSSDYQVVPLRRGPSVLANVSVAAIIAVIIAVTISATVLIQLSRSDQISVPDILGNALTVILGFYFGREVTKARSDGPAAASTDSEG